MITLKRFNVVKMVDSEDKAQTLEEQGFKRVLEPEEGNAAGEKKPPSGKKSAAAKKPKEPEKEGNEKDDSGATGEDSGGGDGQPENG